MKFRIEHLGAVDYAEIETGDLTVLCGENNMGKTYATYSFYGFLRLWRQMLELSLPAGTQAALADKGIVKIELNPYCQEIAETFQKLSEKYSNILYRVFASAKEKLEHAQFELVGESSALPNAPYKMEAHLGKSGTMVLSKGNGETTLEVSLVSDVRNDKSVFQAVASRIRQAIAEIVLAPMLPMPFIVSTERTGAAIFEKELVFARNRMLEALAESERNGDVDPISILDSIYRDYAMPVKDNTDFIRSLSSVSKSKSFLAQDHQELLTDFADLIGGVYKITKDKGVLFVPRGCATRLSMGESSSSVRALLDFGAFLHHVAQPGQLLMIDEPELNLHPTNQRRLARLLARLVNLGLRVFVTTHSDYIVKEFNTLIMLSADASRVKEVCKRHNYRHNELLQPDKVRVYHAQKIKMKRKGFTNKVLTRTFQSCAIDQKLGIEVASFDKEIDAMNAVQHELLFGYNDHAS